MKIGIFGGSFNPITYSHISNALNSIEMCDLDKIVFVPTGDKYGKKDLINSSTRIELIKKVINEMEENNIIKKGQFDIFDYETQSFVQPTTYSTMEKYNEIFPNNELSYICGADVLESMADWGGDVSKLIEEYKIICVDRPETNKNVYFDIINKNENMLKRKKYITVVPAITDNRISSSLVRYRIRNNMSVFGLVPISIINTLKEYYR